MYDRACAKCGKLLKDLLEPMATSNPVCGCGGQLERVFLATGRGTVIGDECDVQIKHGLCNPDGSPRRFTSKAEIAREAKKRGLVNYVEHVGGKSGDKSKHTSRWY